MFMCFYKMIFSTKFGFILVTSLFLYFILLNKLELSLKSFQHSGSFRRNFRPAPIYVRHKLFSAKSHFKDTLNAKYQHKVGLVIVGYTWAYSLKTFLRP